MTGLGVRVLRMLFAGAVLVLSGAGMLMAADGPLAPEAVRDVLNRSVALLQKSAATYVEKRDCFSCHHQGLASVAIAGARRAGFAVDAEMTAEQSDFTYEYFHGRSKRVRVGEGVPGGPYNAGYALWGLHADGRKPDSVTNDLVAYLRTKHRRDGSWRIRTHRPPLEDSHFTATALSLRGLQFYAGKDGAKDLAERIPRTRKWLLKAEAKTNEDRVFRLLGLVWAGAGKTDVQRLASELKAKQRPDGGWSQLPERKGDSYATGQALFALKAAGMKVGDESYQKGCRYLLKTVKSDGSWLVTTRSKAIQKFFDSGFPHEKSQFISICGTCWATLALLELLPSTR